MALISPRRRSIAAFATLLGAIVAMSASFGHSDMDKPLFVATDGVDRGRCLEPAEPCRTIAYALSRVGKGGQIRVAAGRYELADPADVFHIVSGLADVRGGFESDDAFRRPGVARTTLVGVSPDYRSMLASRGLHVVTDRKGLDRNTERRTEKLLALNARQQSGLSAAPCVAGDSSGLPCDRAELISHVALGDVSAAPAAAADVWGLVDLNTNREYAIVGYNSGTAVFDVTDAANPREVGFVDGQNTTWRDIKVYQHFDAAADRWNAYAYVTTDGSTDGLFVIDLSELPQRISRRSYVSDFSAAHNVFAMNTDYGTGLSLTGDTPSLIVAGSNNGGGRFRVYSLSTPEAPGFVAIPSVSNSDYMHDAASMIIRDGRTQQCPNAGDYCEVLFDFNESTVDVWDITDPADPVRLSRVPYLNVAYTHSGWPTEDGQYLFVHDELDEQRFGLQTTVRTLSLADLTAPAEIAAWSGPTRAIDHNGFVRGNRYYMSNYSRGLTILDITDPTALRSSGYLDTYPFSDTANFVGAWGAYPYLPSGNVAVSDISSGLYMVGDETLATGSGRLSFSRSSFGGAEGTSLAITVSRSGGSAGAVGVSLGIVPGTTTSADVALAGGTLSWADGDVADKTLTIDLVADGAAEGIERMLVRLAAPTGGATLAPASVASVYVSDPGAQSIVEFDRPVVDVAERGFGVAVVAVRRRGSAVGAVSVDYSLSGGDAIAGSDFQGATTGTVSWSDGDADPKWIEFELVDDNSAEADEFFELALAPPAGAALGPVDSVRVNVLDGSGSNSAPNAVAGSGQTVPSGADVTLSGSASNDPDGDALSYQWTQVFGTAVTLLDADAANARFTAPTVASDTLLRFQLEVSDARGLADVATTSVTVRAAGSSGASGGGGGAVAPLVLVLLALWRSARRRVIRTDAA